MGEHREETDEKIINKKKLLYFFFISSFSLSGCMFHIFAFIRDSSPRPEHHRIKLKSKEKNKQREIPRATSHK